MKGSSPNFAHSQIELKISCKNLIDLDIFSKSDPQILLSVKDAKTQKWCITPNKTEVVINNLNPTFVNRFVVDYLFEELQQFRFICVDVDKPNDPNWEHQDFIGHFDCDLGSIIGSEGRKMIGNLTSSKHPGKSRGIIIISAEVINPKRNIKLQLQAHNIVKKRKYFEPKTAAFLVVSRINEDNTLSSVYESEVVSSSSPLWKEFLLNESTLCGDDSDKALLLHVKKYRKNGGHKILGECTVTLREILGGNKKVTLKLSPGLKREIPKDASITIIIEASPKEPPSFLDYISGDTEVNLMVAIDFTSSNGDPKYQGSLHYSGGGENDYQRAIRSVGTILEAYDYDRLFPVYGFGARFNGRLSYDYPLNNNYQDPQVEGVEGILSAYLQTINNVRLSGPTDFSPIINKTAKGIKSELTAGNKNAYHILLMITDGIISDVDLTIRAIVEASSLPLSIIIVGVGDADFSYMTMLDDGPLVSKTVDSNGVVSVKTGRDIVQFVAMRDFQTETAGYLLPKAVLEEIPGQFMDYMNKNNISPKPATQKNIDELKVNPRFNITQ